MSPASSEQANPNFRENAMQQSFGSEESDVFIKETLNPFSRGILSGEKGHEKENKLSSTRPLSKKHLLALEAPVRKSQEEYDQITSAGRVDLEGGVHEREGRVHERAGRKPGLEEVVIERARSGSRARAEMPIQESREECDQLILAGKALLEGDVHERVMTRGRRAGVKARGWKSGEEYGKITSGKATPEVGVHRKDTLKLFKERLVRQKKADALKRKASKMSSISVGRLGGQAGEFSRSVGRKDTLKLFKERLVRQKQADALKRKASKMRSISEVGGKSAKVLKVSREPDQVETATASRLSNCEDKSLKSWAREIGKKAVLEAGCTVQYTRRRIKRSAIDAVYTSPKGSSYWSLPRAWQALEKEERKCQIRVEKAVVQQVLSKIDNDEKVRSAFEKLDRFSGTCLQDVMSKANFTYDELTDLLLVDLGVLKRNESSKKLRLSE